jgi:hypothetical protein
MENEDWPNKCIHGDPKPLRAFRSRDALRYAETMKIFALQITDQSTGKSEKVVGEFPDEEIAILEGFLKNLNRLEESKFLQDGMPAGLV